MKTMKANYSRVSGIIILICAMGISILNIILEKNLDSYIMPFILFMVGITYITRKKFAEIKQAKESTERQRVIISTLSISLVIAGIVVFINAFFF